MSELVVVFLVLAFSILCVLSLLFDEINQVLSALDMNKLPNGNKSGGSAINRQESSSSVTSDKGIQCHN